MFSLDEQVLTAFQKELEKKASIPWQALGGNVGSFLGTGAAIGAGIGGLHRASQTFHQAKDEGDSTGTAMLRAGLGGVGGALEGGALGAGAGALAGGAGTALAPKLTGTAAKRLTEGGMGALGRFGQRQVHAFTGWKPEAGLGSIGVGAAPHQAAARAAEERLHGLVDRGGSADEVTEAAEHLQRMNRGRGAAEEVERRGMTSIPGALGALRKDAPGALAAGFKNQWHNAGKIDKTLMLGMPAVDAAMTLAGKEDPEHGKGERLGRSLGGLATGAALAGAPLGAQLAGGMFAGPAIGGLMGKGIDRLRGRQHGGVVNRQPELEPIDNQQHIPTERAMGPAAAGQTPEALG